MAHIRPRLVLSRCLEHDACRYDGQMIKSGFVQALKQHVEIVTVCPEVAIGLGVPRDPIRLVVRGGDELPRLVQPSTERDLTHAMESFAKSEVERLGAVDGFLLKGRSPSCGIRDARLHRENGAVASRGPGLFAREVLERHGGLAIEDEGRLSNYLFHEPFLTKLYTLAELRVLSENPSPGALVAFQARHKLLFLGYNQTRMRKLGRLIANLERRPLAELLPRVRAELEALFARLPARRAQQNVLQHALGYFKRALSPEEKAYFLGLLESYLATRLPLSALLAVLRGWIVRFDVPYLAQQSYFSPYPEALVVQQDSGKGRDF